MLKKTVSALILMGLLSSVGVASANEGELSDKLLNNINGEKLSIQGPNGDSMSDVYIPIEQQKEDLLNEAKTKEEKQKINQTFAEKEELINRINGGITTFGSNTKTGLQAVPYFKQAYSYYCGPATVKQTLQYINGSSPTQNTIASGIGTTSNGSDLASMVRYINNNQTLHSYSIHTGLSEDIIRGIPEYSYRKGAPAILRLKIAKGGNWAYSSAGHFMSVSGYENYGYKIRVTDPYIGWINASSTGSYWVTSNEVYTATNNHFAKQISY